MKYVVILADGMADESIEALENRTPLAYANTPNIDRLAPYSEIGMVHTIPKGCAKGSDTANLCVLGYDPLIYSCGRSALEALSMGVNLEDEDITYRVNLVTLSEEETFEDKMMIDHSADEITTEEAKELIGCIGKLFGDQVKDFYNGVSYRHLMVWHKGSKSVTLVPPHDFLGESIHSHKPTGDGAEIIWEMIKNSYAILNDHPINQRRRERGLKPANAIWLWGVGNKPLIPAFEEKYGVESAVISAVDLIKGIGIGASMTSIDVEGATGGLYTNYQGKAEAGIAWLLHENKDFVYIHLEGPDECGHRQDMRGKIQAIEWIDEKVIGPIVGALEESNQPYKLLIMPDHPTPLRLRTHTDHPVPYMIYTSNRECRQEMNEYTEVYAMKTGYEIYQGYTLMKHFLE